MYITTQNILGRCEKVKEHINIIQNRCRACLLFVLLLKICRLKLLAQKVDVKKCAWAERCQGFLERQALDMRHISVIFQASFSLLDAALFPLKTNSVNSRRNSQPLGWNVIREPHRLSMLLVLNILVEIFASRWSNYETNR